jgi:hypothetical protein
MPTKPLPTKVAKVVKPRIPIAARRVFRLSLSISLSLALAYSMSLDLPYLVPVLAFMLGMQPAPPIALKGLISLLLMVTITMGTGLILSPMLMQYPVSAFLTITLGLYWSASITISQGKVLLGMFLTIGLTLISSAAFVNHQIAVTVLENFLLAITISVVCQWLIYPFFPELEVPKNQPEAAINDDALDTKWLSIRSTLTVLPAFFLALTNPLFYLPIVLKTVSLAQQSTGVSVRTAARELLGSTFLAGCFAILFWFLLDLVTSLWMFACWMLVFAIFMTSKFYQVFTSRFSAEFWQNTFVTMIILLGPAVEDSANGNDVYSGFAIRMGLFVAVSLYAFFAVYLLEVIRYSWLPILKKPKPVYRPNK